MRFGDTLALKVRFRSQRKLIVRTPVSWVRTVQVRVLTPAGGSRRRQVTRFRFVSARPSDASSYRASGSTLTLDPAVVAAVTGGSGARDGSASVPWQVTLLGTAPAVAVGDDLFLPPGSPVFPSGLAGKVAASEDGEADLSVVTVAPVGVDDVLDKVDVAYSGPLHDPQGDRAERHGREGSGGSISFGRIPANALNCTGPDNGAVTIAGSVAYEMQNVAGHFELRAGSWFSKPFLSMYVTFEPVLTADVTIAAEATCTIKPAWQNAHRKVIPLGATGATLSLAPAAEMKLSAEGTIEVSQRSYRMLGVISRRDGTLRSLTAGSSDPVTIKASGRIDFEATAGISLRVGALDRVGIESAPSLGIEGHARAQSNPPRLCIDAALYLSADLDAYLDVWIAQWEHQFVSWRKDLLSFDRCWSRDQDPEPNLAPPEIINSWLPDAMVGETYSAQLGTVDDRPGTWSVTGLPSGLTASRTTGAITGIPNGPAGTALVSITFRDNEARTDSVTLALDVVAEPDPTVCPAPDYIPDAECAALVDLYQSTDGPHWYDDHGWLTDSNPCTWYGVSCTDGSVAYLWLEGNNLAGPLPASIGDLSNAWLLHLKNNQITRLPSQIGNMTALRRLWLGNNALTSVPAAIGNLANLTELDLTGRWDGGISSLPTTIGNLTRLTKLTIDGNQLTQLPASIGGLTALAELQVNGNQLNELPTSLGTLGDLVALGVSNNNLTSLPDEIGDLGELTRLWLGENEITALPSTIGQLSKLQHLELGVPSGVYGVYRGNRLTSLPAEIGELSSLRYLGLRWNGLTGLPESIGNLTGLTEIGLDGNQLTSLPAGIGGLTSLPRLDLSDNSLTTLPPEIGNLTDLTWLDVSANDLTSLPPEVGELTNLVSLNLDGWGRGALTSLPDEIGNLTKLVILDLQRNALTGDISGWAGSLTAAAPLDSYFAIGDGSGGNNCLTVGADAALEARLNALDPRWSECE